MGHEQGRSDLARSGKDEGDEPPSQLRSYGDEEEEEDEEIGYINTYVCVDVDSDG